MKKLLFAIGIATIIGLGIFMAVPNITPKTKNVSQKITIVTTIFPLYDFVKNIGQDKVEVSLLLPPNVDAHTFEPKPSDIVKINKSDLFIYTGKFMEPWAEDIIKSITNKTVKVIDISTGIELMKKENHEKEHKVEHEVKHNHEHNSIDPHIWLDFYNGKIMIQTIALALSEKDSTNSEFYQQNSEEYQNKLSMLDAKHKSTLSHCKSNTIIYGGHYAFGYLAKRYNLKYMAAQGFSPDSEPTAKDLIQLVKHIKKNNIQYIFYEELTNLKIAETIANETKAKMLLLNAAHNIAKEDFEKNISFLSIMEKNLANLKTGLGCNK